MSWSIGNELEVEIFLMWMGYRRWSVRVNRRKGERRGVISASIKVISMYDVIWILFFSNGSIDGEKRCQVH